MQNFISRYKYFFLLIIVACIGYWQVAFFQNTLKWDAIDQYYPWRMFVVECLRSGTLPLWNPYEQLGYPIHADPQSGAWYPVVWLFALFGQYTLYSLQTEFMLHIILGGMGMLLLLETFGIKKTYSFLLACAYMLSGFFIGNAQHITFMVAGCWLPFVFFSYKKIAEQLELKYVVMFSVFCYLLISGGYPAYTIIAFYTLLVAFIFFVINKIKAKDYIALRKFIVCNAIAVLLTLLASCALLVSVFANAEYILRTSGLTYDIASLGPFSPQALISLLLPLAAVKDAMFMDTDISMSGIYLGLVVLLTFLFSLFQKKESNQKIFWLAALLFLLAAFGSYTPVRKLLYDFVPMMDLFRFPAVFRIFTMICFLLIAGLTLSKLDDLKKLKLSTVILFFISAGIAIYFYLAKDATFTFQNSVSLSLNNSILWQSCVQAVFLLVLWFVLKSKADEKRKTFVFIAIALLDLVYAAQLNLPINIIYGNKTKQSAMLIEKRYSHEFKIPELRPVRLNNDSSASIQPLWRNLNIFAKQPAWDGYNSFLLRDYLQFTDNIPLRNKIIESNWAYFADTVIFYHNNISDEQINSSGNNPVFISKGIREKFSLGNDVTENTQSIEAKIFRPHQIQFQANTNHKALFTLMQQYFPGWQIFVDGKKADIIMSNYLFMSVVLEKGNHVVEYVYENKKVKTAFYISAAVFGLCLLMLFYFSFIQHRFNRLPK